MSCILCLGVWCDPWLLRKGPTYFSPWAASWKTSLVVSNASHSKLFRATLVTAVFLLTSAFSNIFFLIENSTRCFRQMTLKSPRLSRLLLSTGQRADVLRAGLKGLIDGSLQVVPPIIGMIYGQAVFFFFQIYVFRFLHGVYGLIVGWQTLVRGVPYAGAEVGPANSQADWRRLHFHGLVRNTTVTHCFRWQLLWIEVTAGNGNSKYPWICVLKFASVKKAVFHFLRSTVVFPKTIVFGEKKG